MARAAEYDTLLGRLSLERRAKYRTEVLAQLRKEGNLVVNEDARQACATSPARSRN